MFRNSIAVRVLKDTQLKYQATAQVAKNVNIVM
jgi:hypothetical protein